MSLRFFRNASSQWESLEILNDSPTFELITQLIGRGEWYSITEAMIMTVIISCAFLSASF